MEFPLVKDKSQILRFVANPKFILSVLALLNVLAVPQRFAGLCFYNWRDAFYLAFTILVASLGLWTATWWGYSGALIVSGTLLYDFSYVLLKVFGFIAIKPSDPEGYPIPEIWLNIMQQHPEELLQVALAAAIFSCAAIYLFRYNFSKRRLFA
ncbi:MAG TPA: hypothetical protein VK363_09325 [Pyrinomonadaceae bacterium]|nr:hypothetical protein [Pyrinomonadaceae bacterium]